MFGLCLVSAHVLDQKPAVVIEQLASGQLGEQKANIQRLNLHKFHPWTCTVNTILVSQVFNIIKFLPLLTSICSILQYG